MESHIRLKSLTFIEWLVTKKSKSIVKLRLLPQILQLLFTLIGTEIPLDDDSDVCDEPSVYALTVLDAIATYIPVELVFQPFVRAANS